MTDIDHALAQRGLVLPIPAAPLAAYVPTVIAGGLLHVSGQVSQADGQIIRGCLGRDMDMAAGAKAAESCAVMILAQVKAALGGDWARLGRCVKLTGYVAATPDFTDHPKVINGASELIGAVLGDAGRHARAAVGVASLPLGAAVEVEAVFEVRP